MMSAQMKLLNLLFLAVLFSGCAAKNRWALKTDGLNPTTDPLWSKAVELVEQNQQWLPGKVTITWKGKISGRVFESEELWIKNSLDENGEIKTEVVKRLRDNREVAGLQNENEMKELASSRLNGGSWFLKENQKEVLIERMNLKTPRQGKTCEGYRFLMKQMNEVDTSGAVWLEEGTGKPTEVKATFRPLPSFVTNLDAMISYDVTSDEVWRITNIKMDAEMVIGTVAMEVAFSEYLRKENPQPENTK